jgi:hypothetical protein
MSILSHLGGRPKSYDLSMWMGGGGGLDGQV